MKKPLRIILIGLFVTALTLITVSHVDAQVGGGGGTIDVLDQFTSTTSPSSAITQRTYGKPLKITGLTTGLCLTLDSNKLLTTTSCGSGGGGTFPFTSNVGYNSTTTTLGFLNGLFSTASSTLSGNLFLPALLQGIVYTGTNGKVGSTATTTASCAGTVSCTDFTIFGSTPITLTGSSSGGLSSYDAWSHPYALTSATTSTMIFPGIIASASSTITGNIDGSNVLFINASASSSPSISVGGLLHVDMKSFGGTGLEVIGNRNASSNGRLVNFIQNGTADVQDMILASSSCANCTAFNLKGAPTGKGIVKIEHTGQGTGNSNSSALSVDLGNATDAQGVFIKGAIGGTGKLLNIVDSGSVSLGSIDSNGLLTTLYSTSTRYSSFLNASSTSLFAGTFTLSTTSAGCASFTSGGVLFSTGVACGSGSGGLTSYDPFTHPYAASSATTSTVYFPGIVTTASSTIGSSLFLSSLGQGVLFTGTNSGVGAVGTSSLAIGASLSNSGALGSQIGGTPSSLSINTGNSNTWTVNQNFNYSSSTIYSSFLNASTTNLIINGSSFNNLLGAGHVLTAGALGCATANTSTFGCLTANDFNKFNSATTTFSTGLTYSNATNAVTVNTSQNIATLSNLTSNGFVYTANGGGTLNVAASTSIFGFTPASNAITLTAGNGLTGGGDLTTNRSFAIDFTRANSWTGLQTFNYSSSTAYSSFNIASTTNLFVGTPQGFLFTGSNGLVGSVASSSIKLSSLSNDLATLTATDATLTFSGSYNGATARTVGLNLGNSNTWTVNQNFNYSSSTIYSSFLNASSTNYLGAGLTACNATTGKLTWASGQFGCGTDFNTGLSTYDAWTHATNGLSATTSQMAVGTSTATIAQLTVATSTTPQISLSEGAAKAQVVERLAGGVLSFATTSAAGTSTSTPDFMTINTNAGVSTAVGIGTSSPWRTLSVVGTVGFQGLTGSAGLQVGILCLSATNEVINESVACVASAKRFKENIQPLRVGLSELVQLQPVAFSWKDSFNGPLKDNPNFSGTQYSLIADDVQKVDPHLVSVETGTTTFDGVTYAPGTVHGLADTNHWIALIVQSIKDFYGEFQTLVARVSGLENRINAQQKQIDNLQAQINALKK